MTPSFQMEAGNKGLQPPPSPLTTTAHYKCVCTPSFQMEAGNKGLQPPPSPLTTTAHYKCVCTMYCIGTHWYGCFVDCNHKEELSYTQAHTEVDVDIGPHPPHGPV